MKRCRIIFSGSGGQGLITAARILAEAAAIAEQKVREGFPELPSVSTERGTSPL